MAVPTSREPIRCWCYIVDTKGSACALWRPSWTINLSPATASQRSVQWAGLLALPTRVWNILLQYVEPSASEKSAGSVGNAGRKCRFPYGIRRMTWSISRSLVCDFWLKNTSYPVLLPRQLCGNAKGIVTGEPGSLERLPRWQIACHGHWIALCAHFTPLPRCKLSLCPAAGVACMPQPLSLLDVTDESFFSNLFFSVHVHASLLQWMGPFTALVEPTSSGRCWSAHQPPSGGTAAFGQHSS